MIVLGVGDGAASGAALVVDGTIACVATEPAGAEGLPLSAMAAVLEDAGVRAGDVDVVALAGRFSTPLIVRRFPALEELSDTVALRRASAVWQTALRASGFGALQADRAATWLAARLSPLGYAPRQIRTVDLHTCLAAAAYRCQPRDDAIVVTVEPHADGLLVAVHHGLAGHLERAWEQRAEPALHTHLERCARILDLHGPPTLAAFDALAEGAEPDADLAASLGPAIAGRRLSGGLDNVRAAALAGTLPDVAAASVAAALRAAVIRFVKLHLRAGAPLAVAGSWIADPKTVTALGALEVDSVACGPDVGGATAALGAALHEIGTPPRAVPATVGPRDREERLRALLHDGEELRASSDGERVVNLLARGAVVGRIAGRGGNGALGTRSILCRVGDGAALDRARRLSAGVPARLVASIPPGLERLAPSLVHGMVDAGGRIRVVEASDDPALAALVRTSPEGLFALPLADDPSRALTYLREGRLDALVWGSIHVQAA